MPDAESSRERTAREVSGEPRGREALLRSYLLVVSTREGEERSADGVWPIGDQFVRGSGLSMVPTRTEEGG